MKRISKRYKVQIGKVKSLKDFWTLQIVFSFRRLYSTEDDKIESPKLELLLCHEPLTPNRNESVKFRLWVSGYRKFYTDRVPKEVCPEMNSVLCLSFTRTDSFFSRVRNCIEGGKVWSAGGTSAWKIESWRRGRLGVSKWGRKWVCGGARAEWSVGCDATCNMDGSGQRRPHSAYLFNTRPETRPRLERNFPLGTLAFPSKIMRRHVVVLKTLMISPTQLFLTIAGRRRKLVYYFYTRECRLVRMQRRGDAFRPGPLLAVATLFLSLCSNIFFLAAFLIQVN